MNLDPNPSQPEPIRPPPIFAGQPRPEGIPVDTYRPESRVGAGRNLALGIGFTVLAALVGAAAFILAGPRALLWPAGTLLAGLACWTLSQMRVLQQKNGAFVAIGLAVFVGTFFPLIEKGYVKLAEERDDKAAAVTAAATAAVPVAPVAPAPTPKPAEPELFTAVYPAPAKFKPEQASLTVNKDLTIQVGEKTYRLKTGEKFPVEETRDGEYLIAAGNLRASVPTSAASLTPGKAPAVAPAPKPLTAADKTRRAQNESVKRYPALGIEGSIENILFLEKYNQLKADESDLLEDAEWPLHVAEMLAQSNKWQRADKVPPTEEERPTNFDPEAMKSEPSPEPAAPAPAEVPVAPEEAKTAEPTLEKTPAAEPAPATPASAQPTTVALPKPAPAPTAVPIKRDPTTTVIEPIKTTLPATIPAKPAQPAKPPVDPDVPLAPDEVGGKR